MKKFLVMIISFLLVFSLAGCGAQTVENTPAEAKENEQAEQAEKGTLEYAYSYLMKYINGEEYICETFNSAMAYDKNQSDNGVFLLFDCNGDGNPEVFATGGDTWTCISTEDYSKIRYYDPESGRLVWSYDGGASSNYYGYGFYSFDGTAFNVTEKWVSEEDFIDDEFQSVRKFHDIDGVETELSDDEFEDGMNKISERLISLMDMDAIYDITPENIEKYLKTK